MTKLPPKMLEWEGYKFRRNETVLLHTYIQGMRIIESVQSTTTGGEIYRFPHLCKKTMPYSASKFLYPLQQLSCTFGQFLFQ